MDKGRIEDIKELKKDLEAADNPHQVQLIKEAGTKIRKEQQDQRLRDARKDMIGQRIQGNQENVKDIQDRMISTGQTRSYGFLVSAEKWNKIFNG